MGWKWGRYWERRRFLFGEPGPWNSPCPTPEYGLAGICPGNLIYANGNRFVARRFHRDMDEDRAEMPIFEISSERQAVKPTCLGIPATTLGNVTLQTISVCDVDLVHQSHISDEEEFRFQMGVAVYGMERDERRGGKAYKWGEQNVHHRRGVSCGLST